MFNHKQASVQPSQEDRRRPLVPRLHWNLRQWSSIDRMIFRAFD